MKARTSSLKEAARANVRGQLLDTASRILAAEGSDALGIRRITDEIGVSTMVFYTTFGCKQGLMEALWLEGFERFYNLQMEVIALNLSPIENLVALSKAYRTHALTNPEYFGITFGGAIKADTMPEEVRKVSRRVFENLKAAVIEAMTAKLLTERDPHEVTVSLWASAHGYCMLEVAKFFGDKTSDEVFERHITACLKTYLA